jgi:hypothetical protein
MNKDGKKKIKHSIGYEAQENLITRKASKMGIQQTTTTLNLMMDHDGKKNIMM